MSYVLSDAQRCDFEPGRFDLAISRFGLMFFSDPAAAFTNIASALRPQARLVALVWQRRELNEWALAIAAARLEDVDEPVFYGHDIDAALETVCGFDGPRSALAAMSRDDANRAIGRMRETLEGHCSDDQGVAFASRSWLITGRRSRSQTPNGPSRITPRT